MSHRQKLAQALDRALLGSMMFAIAFVMEKALNRMVEPRTAETEPPSRVGRSIFRRLLPGFSAQVQHHHQS